MADSAPFTGFPQELEQFLLGLGEHNEKSWFDAHRATYESAFVEPAKRFVAALGPAMAGFAPDIHAEPRVNGSIFRINRDTRFSKDKRPYKDHLDLMLWEGSGRSRECPGYFFRYQPPHLYLGAGLHGFHPPMLAAYRAAVLDETLGPALETAAAAVVHGKSKGAELGGQGLKRVPRGYAAEHPRAGWLLYTGLFVHTESQAPKALSSHKLVDYCVERFRTFAPLQQWLLRVRGG